MISSSSSSDPSVTPTIHPSIDPLLIHNVALNKSATQSSTDHGGVVCRAVDGNTNGDWYNGGTLTHTDPTMDNPWWQVDLQEIYTINSISVKNRADCCEYRLDYFIVEVYNYDGSMMYSYHHNSTCILNETFTIENMYVIGSMVRIRREGTSISLTLAEVEVNGCCPDSTQHQAWIQVLY